MFDNSHMVFLKSYNQDRSQEAEGRGQGDCDEGRKTAVLGSFLEESSEGTVSSILPRFVKYTNAS